MSRRASRRNVVRAVASNCPPTTSLTPHINGHRLRHGATSGGSHTVTFLDMVGAIGGICTVVNNTHAAWASAFRIRAIHMYPPALSAATSNGVRWVTGASNFVADDLEDSTLPGGITLPTHLVFKPPARALAADWITNSGSNTLFQLDYSTGTVIDIIVDYRLSAGLTAQTQTIATGVLGKVYYLPLDQGSGTNTLPPALLPTTH